MHLNSWLNTHSSCLFPLVFVSFHLLTRIELYGFGDYMVFRHSSTLVPRMLMDFGQYLLGERLNKLTLGTLLCVELSKLLLLRPAPAPSPHHPQTRAQWPHHPRREWSARVPRYPPPYSPYRSPRGPHRWDCCGVSSPGPGSSGTWGLHPRASGRRPGFHPQTVSKQTTEREAGAPASSGSCSLSPTTAGTPLHLASKWEPSWFGDPPQDASC